MLHEMLSRLAETYAYERANEFTGSEFGNFVRHDIAVEAKKQLTFLPYNLTIKSSVGNGNWAAVPWLAFFDPLVTKSATKGFYVVYLINSQERSIFLSLNQGATEVYEEFGTSRGTEVLKRRAIDMRERIPEFSSLFSTSSIDLGSQERLPVGYMAGHSFGRMYSFDQINPISFYQDLEQMLTAYEVLIDRGGVTPIEAMAEGSESTTVEEIRRYALSRRIERAPNVRKDVLAKRNSLCEACGLDPEIQYGFSGHPSKTPLDVHHSVPIMTLREGETRRYKVPDDFLVLCPTCHRMIHKQSDPSDLELLKSSLTFNHARKK